MKKVLALTLALSALSQTVSAAGEYKYGWMTGNLPGTDIIAANVVREPAFAGERDEQAQAMDQAKRALEADYCAKQDSEFVVDPGLIVFDKGINEWLVGGVCR